MEIKISNYVQTKNVFYIVEAGDSLDSVATLFNVPKDYIKNNNTGEFYQGKVLFLPETNFSSYVVQPFDTLQKIANTNGTTVDALMLKNNLSNDYVFVGQKIFI